MNGRVAALIWLGLGLGLQAFAFLFYVESYTYWNRIAPITVYIRNWTWGHWLLAVFVGLGLVAGISAAFTHFILDGK